MKVIIGINTTRDCSYRRLGRSFVVGVGYREIASPSVILLRTKACISAGLTNKVVVANVLVMFRWYGAWCP